MLSTIHRLYKLLPSLYKRKLIQTSIGMFLIAFADLISLGILLPVLLLVLDENNILQNSFLALLYKEGGFQSSHSFVGVVCLVVLFISLGRTVFNTYMQYIQNKRLYEVSSYLSLRLFQSYYRNGFLYIKKKNSHYLINRINAVSLHLIQGYFIPFTSLVCEIFVILFILAGLIVFSPYVFLLVFFTFVPISLIYYRYSRSRIKKYGEFLFNIIPQKNKLLQQTFTGYADMEMSNSFIACQNDYVKLLEEQNGYSVKSGVLNSSLQRVLELGVVCSVAVLIMATQFLELPSLGIIIGVFVIAIYRLLPGVIKGSSYYFLMRSNAFALDILNDLEQSDEKKNDCTQREITFHNSIRFENVSFSYDQTVPVLNCFSLEIKKGDVIGIKGESGSGKSTLFHLLLGFLRPDSGTIYVDSQPLLPDYINSWHNKIGYVSQQLFMVEGTLLDNIVMGVDKTPDRNRAHEVLRLASLDKFVDSQPKGLDTFVGEGGCLLSGGQRQRLGIARALYKNVELLLFDEATSSLDENTEKVVNEAILRLVEQQPGLTILIISHRVESLMVCRRIVDLSKL